MTEVEQLAAQVPGGGPPPRFDRITGPDRTGTAFAVVDEVGRFVDIGLHPAWWLALGPAGVADALLEALATARLKAALVPMILRRHGHTPSSILVVEQHTVGNVAFLDAARGRIAEASRLIADADPEPPAARVITGTHGLFRLHVRGSRIDRAEVTGVPDTDRLVADAREVLMALTSGHATDDRGTR
ncbi:hypothetical protein BJ973_008044 [Actinoplanes tereljensis]|uniref:Uncharacterized protein n=1 Tax=Paractinoplanes tereljensis TaxID=571912 RepID=A0A919NSZ7_9ACTN|nr:hypothetical protein [Actinoplanes tereljensis]GIF24565.1 hypothetical protein Ate02nite_72950 [Actinoplanes tereljensis]